MKQKEKILGIIAEYNPLHNGHVYHISESKKRIKPDYTVAIISGNFTQRGEPSIIDKFEKAKQALNNGIDLVIELPTIYSVSSAENFAYGGINILKQIGTTHISFGTEEADISRIHEIAELLFKEPKDFVNYLKEELKKGNSYPSAREKAISKYFKTEGFKECINKPNNILAIEYVKNILKQKANIEYINIKRFGNEHNSKKTANNYASSTAIRELICNKQYNKIKDFVPKNVYELLMKDIDNGLYNDRANIFESIIIYKLRTMREKEISEIPEVTEGLENKIKKAVFKTNKLEELLEILKSKRYTQTRLQRILIYTLLGIKKEDIEISKEIKPYIRILGANEKGKKLLSKLSKKRGIKIITSVKDFEKNNTNIKIQKILNIDKQSTDIYTIGYKRESCGGLDYTHKLITK